MKSKNQIMSKDLPCWTHICLIFGIFFGLLLMSAPIMGYEGYNSPALSKIFCSNNGEVCKNIILGVQYILDFVLGLLIFLSGLCALIYNLFGIPMIKEMGKYFSSPLIKIIYPNGLYHLFDWILRVYLIRYFKEIL